MSHAPNPQHLPPAKSAREYEREIERKDKTIDWLRRRLWKCGVWTHLRDDGDLIVVSIEDALRGPRP